MADIMDEDPSSGLQSSGEEDEEAEESGVPAESLISGRAKRSTAGRHMSALIDAAADDDLTLLFEEVDEDNEFAMEAEAAEEEDMGLGSSSDDEDDQGPNAQNDYEGEKELQREERKKRKTQNDLRFQTLRKRVKIDPTAVSSAPAAAPRPKKKSERISWLPTVEDGPTRSSSRRQTMVNKELTHARLKDSQEKRIRIIATMKEAEKRKAHLKPKEMTQEDHLAEAARVERLNSKSLNRWEQTEKRKAEERKAKIEALQNRRLEGPVISYWSGLATWTNGRLTRVGKVDIKVKPEKDEAKKKKKAEEKAAAETQGLQNALPQQPSMGAPEGTSALPASGPTEPSKPDDEASGQQPITEPPADNEKPSNARSPSADSRLYHRYPTPVVEIPAPPRAGTSTPKQSSDPTQKEHPPTAKAESMDVDQNPPPNGTAKVDASHHQSASDQTNSPTATGTETQTGPGETTQATTVPDQREEQPSQDVTPQPAPATTPLDPQASTISSTSAAPMQAAPADNAAIHGQTPSVPAQSHELNGPPAQPEGPPPPPVIEHTGRNLTILENFDDKTAHSKKYSMYFNAKKPPRLTSMLPLVNPWVDANAPQRSRHRSVSSLHCRHVIAIRRLRSPTPTPTPMARSGASCRKGIPGARCSAASLVPQTWQRAVYPSGSWTNPPLERPSLLLPKHRTHRQRAKMRQALLRVAILPPQARPSRWMLTSEDFLHHVP